jgi:hypothetical protein
MSMLCFIPKIVFFCFQVFTFFMLNAVFVTAIYLLQKNKEMIFIKWPLDVKSNVTYIPSVSERRTGLNWFYNECSHNTKIGCLISELSKLASIK